MWLDSNSTPPALKVYEGSTWVQLGAAIKHSNHGQVFDVSDRVREETGIEDPYLKIYPNSGYGDPQTLRQLIEIEKPDAIIHFTDPRFWSWLYQMEYELKHFYKIPLIYYAIWDNFPYPLWNKSAYGSCDLIMGISKQSHLIHKKVLEYANIKTHDISNNLKSESLKDYTPGDVLVSYVPHGIDSSAYRPILPGDVDYDAYTKFSTEFHKQNTSKFVVFWSNRNIRRKNPADLIHAFQLFLDKLEPEKRDECVLLMHTAPQDPNGTDLVAVKRMVAPNAKVLFSVEKLSTQHLNFYYNLADVTVNIASNEGFGLSSAESIMAGTPVINNVTGGLQDQMRFIDSEGKWFTPNSEVTSNHRKTYTECGEWAFPVWPSSISMQGSLATPYIFDDRVLDTEVAAKIYEVYQLSREDLKARGSSGRKWLMSEECGMSAKSMAKGIGDGIDAILKVWKQPKKYALIKIDELKQPSETGVTL
jgi:glycosyltransferase involved in cell wall biosynthesis